jgi:hypothetical protein
MTYFNGNYKKEKSNTEKLNEVYELLLDNSCFLNQKDICDVDPFNFNNDNILKYHYSQASNNLSNSTPKPSNRQEDYKPEPSNRQKDYTVGMKYTSVEYFQLLKKLLDLSIMTTIIDNKKRKTTSTSSMTTIQRYESPQKDVLNNLFFTLSSILGKQLELYDVRFVNSKSTTSFFKNIQDKYNGVKSGNSSINKLINHIYYGVKYLNPLKELTPCFLYVYGFRDCFDENLNVISACSKEGDYIYSFEQALGSFISMNEFKTQMKKELDDAREKNKGTTESTEIENIIKEQKSINYAIMFLLLNSLFMAYNKYKVVKFTTDNAIQIVHLKEEVVIKINDYSLFSNEKSSNNPDSYYVKTSYIPIFTDFSNCVTLDEPIEKDKKGNEIEFSNDLSANLRSIVGMFDNDLFIKLNLHAIKDPIKIIQSFNKMRLEILSTQDFYIKTYFRELNGNKPGPIVVENDIKCLNPKDLVKYFINAPSSYTTKSRVVSTKFVDLDLTKITLLTDEISTCS